MVTYYYDTIALKDYQVFPAEKQRLSEGCQTLIWYQEGGGLGGAPWCPRPIHPWSYLWLDDDDGGDGDYFSGGGDDYFGGDDDDVQDHFTNPMTLYVI